MSKKSFREESPTYQIGITGQLSNKVFHKLLTEANIDLTPEQVGLLNSLLEKDGSSMQELSTINNRDNSATTRLIDHLEKKEFVERKSSETDRRIWKIFITERGKGQIIKANSIGRDYVGMILKGIGKKDLTIFMNVIKSIKKNITELE